LEPTHLRIYKELRNEGDENRIFEKLAFCIFTPQSKAKVCWNTVKKLKNKVMVQEGEESEIAEKIKKVRFRFNKAGYLVEARKKFLKNDEFSLKDKLSDFSDSRKAREWIVENIKGLRYKEASHFLRNIGLCEDLAILDRHIWKNLKGLDVIDKTPKTLTKKGI
jgi:N-glycosylase/DNA lyase